MNTKTANLIALELGILIAILAWLAFSHFPAGNPRNPHPATEVQKGAADSFATLTPLLRSRNQPRPAVDYHADLEPAQPPDEEPAPTVQQYDQQIATTPYLSSGLQNDFIAGDSPYYADVEQEPVIPPPDYFVSPVTQIIEYTQPTQIIIFSSPRSFVNRHRSPPCFGGAPMVFAHRRPPQGSIDRITAGGGGEPRARSSGIVPRRNISARSSQPMQGLRPH